MGTVLSTVPVTPPASSRLTRIGSFFREELKFSPGRLKATFVRVGGTILAMWVGLALNVPEVSAVLALAFFGSSINREESKKISFGVPPAVLVLFIVLSFVLNVFGAAPLVRTIAFIVIVFTSLYLLQAAQAGAVFLLAGIFGKLFLELWDEGYPASVTQDLQFWIVVDLALAGVCALFVSFVFGEAAKDPATALREEFASRFDLLARFFRDPASLSENDKEKIREEAFCASEKVLGSLQTAAKKNASVKSRQKMFSELSRLTALLFHQSVALQTYSPESLLKLEEALSWIGGRCAAIAQAVRSDERAAVAPDLPHPTGDWLASTMISTVNLAENVLAGKASLPGGKTQQTSKGFLRADAFTNPAYLNNAARAFAAAFACYCLISGAMWSGIGTAVTTCLITSLTAKEQARQKQSLRIAGAVVGAILGIFVIVFILPRGGGITGLSIVTAVVTFAGGWLYAGGPNISYAGVQLALCYYLGVFGESKTPTSLVSMRDRVVGILIGNIAMWLFYDRIQPAWTVNSARNGFADELAAIGRLAGTRAEAQDGSQSLSSLSRERDLFLKASSGLKAMSDDSNFGLTPWNRNQLESAPLIQRTETRLRQLFSLEVVQIEARLLFPTAIHPEAHSRQLSASLLAYSSTLKSDRAVQSESVPVNENASSGEEKLFARIRIELANLF